ncbi:SDR family NAD(P)-dependent oxidoreductase [Spongiibacter nanhainus]|uniref:SDR family NAD(P)-dependent oxidoreductase n=1 Tax=Spongiibacter nanhainus TaxID=2794344 RepID=UPI003B589107
MSQLKHNLITGAGSGLGLGIACRLLRRGENVSVLDLVVPPTARASLNEAALQGQAKWHSVEMDIRDEANVQSAVAEAIALFGPPGLALNCAGIVLNKTISAMKGEEFALVVDINLNGSFYFVHAVLPHLLPGSRLALIASVAGFTSNYAYSAYGASKFGVIGLAKTLRYEYSDSGIGITCVCPPEVETPLVFKEREQGDPVALGIKALGGCLSADYACDKIVAGLDKGTWMIIPGRRAKGMVLLSRLLPETFHAVMAHHIRKLRRTLAGKITTTET